MERELFPCMLEYNEQQNNFHFNPIKDDWTFEHPLESYGWQSLCMVDVNKIYDGGIRERKFFELQEEIQECWGAYDHRQMKMMFEELTMDLGVHLTLPYDNPPRRPIIAHIPIGVIKS